MNNNALTTMSGRLSVSPERMQSIIMNTVMPNGGKGVTQDQFVSFVAVANEYGLNPLTKEVYAFPAKGGGIQPIVSIDGWLRIINNHPQFNGMVFEDIREEGKLIAVKCKIYKKEIDHPVEVVEYMDECYQPNKEPWKKWPSRMLRHKAAIQCGRYAFGLSGIIDPDEAERYRDTGVIEVEPVKDIQDDVLLIEKCQSMPELTEVWSGVYSRHIGKPSLKQLNETKDSKKQALMPASEEPKNTEIEESWEEFESDSAA